MPLVECHSGSEYAERPIALYWDGERLEIEAVEQQWRTPAEKWFRVRTPGGRVFELGYAVADDRWHVSAIERR